MTSEHDEVEFYGEPVTVAEQLIHERGSRYGRFLDQASVAVAIKEIMHNTPNWQRLAPDQREALDAFAMKASRALIGDPNYVDNWRDIEAYFKLVADRLESDQMLQRGS